MPPPFDTNPPVPSSGFLLGDGEFVYEEINSIGAPEGSMQRGGFGGTCFPPPPWPCLFLDEDPVQDQNCGHGPDMIIFGSQIP